MILSEHWPKTIEDALVITAAFIGGLPVVILYIRVSSLLQVEENYSLETQMESLRPECCRRFPGGCHIICIADEGISGKLPWRKEGMRESQYRPGLTMVKELVALGVVNAVGVYKCNRFTRRLRIWLDFEEDYLDPNGVLFFSADECIDTGDPASRMVFCVLMSGAEYELGQIAGGVKDGLRRRRDEGYHCGCPPYGWTWQDERAVADGCRISIEPIEEEAKVIRRICESYLDGLSPGKIAGALTCAGIPTATGGDSWAKVVVKHILRSPTNAGLVRDGSGELVQGAHYARRIIEREVFYKVQEKLAARREAAMDSDRPIDLIFDGKLKCSLCGAILQLSSPNGEIVHYLCPGRKNRHPHKGYWLRVDLVESRLQKAILDSAAAQAASARAAVKLREDLDSHEHELKKEARRLKDRLARNESDICLWAGRSGGSEYDPAEVDDELTYLARERGELEAKRERNRKDSKRHRSRRARCEAAVVVAQQLLKLWSKATVAEKRELIDRLAERILCEPTDSGVTVHIQFITGEDCDVRFHVRAKAAQDCGDLWAIGPSLLTTACYLRQGLSIREIAAVRGIKTGTAASQVSRLRRITGKKDLKAVVEVLAHVLDARADELYFEDKKPPKSGGRPRKWTARQLEFLKLRTSGLTLPQVAKEMGLSLPGAGSLQMRVHQKLGAHCVADALAAAGQKRLFGP